MKPINLFVINSRVWEETIRTCHHADGPAAIDNPNRASS